MANRGFLTPRAWTVDELRRDQELAVARFIANRGAEGTKLYESTFRDVEPTVRALFVATHDLRALSGEVFSGQPGLIDAGRYLAGPPVSADDLRTLVGKRVGRREMPPDTARRVAGVVHGALDPIRFPWLAEDRDPTKSEREAAVRWTAGLWAVERVRTARRSKSASLQEARVAATVDSAGWKIAPRKTVRSLDDLARGHYMRETRLAGVKCDLPVRLGDGRLLALECKMSNSAVNSFKRLNHEVASKAAKWRTAFGDQVVTGAILAGVFKLENLSAAQETGLTIVWDHDLTPLVEFLESTRA